MTATAFSATVMMQSPANSTAANAGITVPDSIAAKPQPRVAVNAMLAAQTMTGADGIRVFGLPGDRVVEILRKYNRMK